MKNPIILLFFLLLASVSLAQNRQIAGTVMGEDGLPVLGATVQVKGTSIGASTDLDGKYSIQASSTDILIFTYLGLQTLEELVGQRNVVDVVLKDSTNELDQIIVTGYSKQKKSRSTSATLIVDEEVVQNQARPTLQESLQGNAAGVEVNNLSGQPGATPNVRIRGVGTFEGAAPLYVIDGFQTRDAGIIAQLNPNDVKSLQILKDAAGLAIYGTRGANGVIVITTKQGRAGKTKVNYSSLAGFTDLSVQDDFKPLGTPEFQELLVEGVINNPGLPNNPNDALTYLTDRGFNPDVNTDWYDLITQTGFFQQHNVSVSGGSEKSRYFISGSYQNTEGTIQSSDAELMNIRVNLDLELTQRLTLSPRLNFSKRIQNVRPDGGAFANPVRAMFRIRPDISPYNEDGTFNFDFNNTHNPIAQAEQEIRRNTDYRANVGTNAHYRITDGLSVRSEIALNYTFVDDFIRRPVGFGDARELGDGFQDSDFLFTWNWRNIVAYNKEWGSKHSIDAFAGYEVIRTRNKFTDLGVENISNNFEDLAAGATPTQAETAKFINGNNGVFLNGEYSYDEKYLVSATVRRDGSSRFGPANQYGVFFGGGLGWNIAKESFMDDVTWVNELKLRSSYGEVGNDNIGANQFISLVGTNDYAGNPGSFYATFGNPTIQWETQSNFDLGIDFSFLNNRIQGSLNYYIQDNEDLLRDNFPISSFNGDTTVAANIGAIRNDGWELQLNSRNIVSRDNGFEWQTIANFAANNNEIISLGGDGNPIIEGALRLEEGQDRFTYFAPLYAGVDPANGDALWYTDGTRTQLTNNYGDAERAVVGKATPDFTLGLRNKFTYKGFGLDVLLYYKHGGIVYDPWTSFTQSDGSRGLSDTGNVSRGTYQRRWQQPGDVTNVPRFEFQNDSQSNSFSSRYMYDGTFLRVRDVTLSYDFDSIMLDKFNLKSFSVFVRGSNLFTWIKDDRLERDPEAGVSGGLNQRIPIARTIAFGLNVSL